MLPSAPRSRPSLRALLAEPGLLVVPGAYDVITARLVEQAGFPACYMTGSGVSISALGSPLNVLRTVAEFERRGAAAIQIEDQEMPKMCGHEPGRRLVPVEEMTAK